MWMIWWGIRGIRRWRRGLFWVDYSQRDQITNDLKFPKAEVGLIGYSRLLRRQSGREKPLENAISFLMDAYNKLYFRRIYSDGC